LFLIGVRARELALKADAVLTLDLTHLKLKLQSNSSLKISSFYFTLFQPKLCKPSLCNSKVGVWVKQRPYSPLVSTAEMAIFGKLS
jgi:hypothetical protein